jgi:O-antigen/teichoic acid export membrane protein
LKNHYFILIILAFCQTVISFINNYIVVRHIGFGAELDVYYIALAVYVFLFSSIGWSISSILTPMFVEGKEENIEGQVLIVIFVVTIPAFFIVILTMYFWGKLIYVNYLQEVEYLKILTIQFIFIISFIFSVLNVVFLSIFQANGQYVTINSINIISASVGLCFVYFTIEKFGVYSASVGFLLMQAFLFFVMGGMLYKKISSNCSYNQKMLNVLWRRSKHLFYGSLYFRTEELVDRFISSFLATGFLSLSGFVQRVYGAIITVLNTSIAGPTITRFSFYFKLEDLKSTKKHLFFNLIILFLIVTGIFIVVICCGEGLFLYFFNDKVDENLLPILFDTILFLFAIVYGKTLGQVLQSLLLSYKFEREVTINEVVSYTIIILLKVILTYIFGIYGFLFSVVCGELLKNIAKYYLISKKVLSNVI